MANLPDLDSNLISMIAYWDVGVEITKADVLDICETYTEYDNGVDAIIRINMDGSLNVTGGQIRMNCRFRTDGLILTWANRSDEPTTNTEIQYTYSSVRNFNTRLLLNTNSSSYTSQNGNPGSYETCMAFVLDHMEGQVTDGLKTAVSFASVNYYNYLYPTINTIYVLMEWANTTSGDSDDYPTFTEPLTGVNIKTSYWQLWYGSSSSSADFYTQLNGVNLCQAVNIASTQVRVITNHLDDTELAGILSPKTNINTVRHYQNEDTNASMSSRTMMMLWVEE